MPTPAAADDSNGVLLVVDDTPANLSALLPSLEAAGFDVLVATSGEQALQRARLGAPEVVLLDVVMPGMDGFETCRRLKADAALADIPVIFMSALSDTAEKLAAFEAGGVDYIVKPFDSAEVLERVRAHLLLCRFRRALEERNGELERATAQLQAISEAMTRYLQSGDLHAASGVLLARALHRAGRDRGAMGIVEAGGALRVLATRGMRDDVDADVDGDGGGTRLPIPNGDGVIGRLWLPGAPLALSDEDCAAVDQLLRSAGVLYAFELLKRREAESQRLRQAAEDTVVVLAEEIKAHHHAGRIVGDSPALREVLAQVERVAPTDSTVLILGETGTGKELIARAIHELSPRRGRPLIRVNCAAIPETLVESELFGHEKGAFTGATAQRKGRVELADRGTLFLDEVGDMPLAAQGKLLRVLQEREFERVGGSATIRVDVRVLAATHRDLRRLVADGAFRQGLYYRLDVVPIRVPPLRERPGDVAALATAFVHRSNARHGGRVRRISQAGLDRLAAYHWPGNVRELENVIERAVILAAGPVLELADVYLPADDGGSSRAHAAMPARAQQALLGTVHDVQRDHILRVLEHTHWVIEGDSGAAARLGLKPSTLRNRMHKLGVHKVAGRAG